MDQAGPMTVIARHLIIHGRVQGVFYRNWMVAAAHDLGIAGWVRNRMNGTVEAFVEGSPEAVEQMLQLAHQGPAAAKVDRIVVQDVREEGLPNFQKRPTT